MLAFTNPDRIGFIPLFLSEQDPRPAAEQFHEAYAHGGGWMPFGKGQWEITLADDGAKLKYPGDRAMLEVSRAKLREETIIVFECSWVAIIQPDGSFEVSRMD